MTRVVVVGAGSAGAALAARLSEDIDRDVVLLEAGRADGRYPPELLDGSTVRGAMPGHPANWGYRGELTADLPYTIARGRIAGGSSTINGGYFIRARPEDFARWATVGGAAWEYPRAVEVLRALESDLDFGGFDTRHGAQGSGPARRPGQTGRPMAADAGIHGQTGPLPVRRPPLHGPLASAFVEAALELGFPEEPDKNAPGTPGIGPVPCNVIDGIRINTGTAYLEPARARPNLTVRGSIRVLRVVVDRGRAVGVETTAGRIDADEVVLCAGAIGSAHLLQVSGIGPADQLRAAGVGVTADLPVGEAFSDHPDIAVGWRPRRPMLDPGERAAFPAALNFSSDSGYDDLEVLLAVKPLSYLLTGSTRMWAGSAAALRHPIRFARAIAGTSRRRAAAQVAHGDDYQFIVGLQAPLGRGRLSLLAADPLTQPRIQYRYLEEPADRARMRTGIRTAVDLLRSRAFTGVFSRLTELDGVDAADDAALDRWMLSHLGTAIHMCGTAPMGPVVDGTGRVHGVSGLRVADTSILPDVPHRGPAATAVFIGELVARAMRRG